MCQGVMELRRALMVGCHDGVLDGREGGHRVAVRAAQRLGDDLVHDAELDQLRGRDAQRLRGLQQKGTGSGSGHAAIVHDAEGFVSRSSISDTKPRTTGERSWSADCPTLWVQAWSCNQCSHRRA